MKSPVDFETRIVSHSVRSELREATKYSLFICHLEAAIHYRAKTLSLIMGL